MSIADMNATTYADIPAGAKAQKWMGKIPMKKKKKNGRLNFTTYFLLLIS